MWAIDKKQATYLSAATIAVIALLVILSPIGQMFQVEQSRSASDRQIKTLHASWGNYIVMSNLEGNSTDIVSGQVTGIDFVNDKADIPTTDYIFRVDDVIKGELKSGDLIIIRQTGTENAAQIVELDDDPLLKVGESFIGFLSYSAEHDVYPILGGPQGRFVVEGGTVGSLDTIVPEAEYIPIKAHGKSLDQFTQEVREEMAK